MASGELPPGVLLVVLFVSACLMITTATPVCPDGTKQYYNQAIDVEVCCQDIRCDRGKQPMPCDGTSPTSTCATCSEGYYQPVGRSLSDQRSYRNCRAKTNCDFYLDKGTTTTNAKCGCPPDKFDSGDGICLPRPECPPGEGQTMMGSCERCIEGKTFSDKSSFTEHCMAVTNCKLRSKCLVKAATIISDNECGPITVALGLCKFTLLAEKTSATTTISIQPEVTPQSPQSSSGSIPTIYYVVMIVLALVPVAGIIRFVMLFVMQRRQHPHKQCVDVLWLTLKQIVPPSKPTIKSSTDDDSD